MTLDDVSLDWSDVDGIGLTLVVPVDGFRTAVVLLVKLGEIAEAMNYSPDISITGNKVTITLIDRELSAITEREYEFAKAIDVLLSAADTAHAD